MYKQIVIEITVVDRIMVPSDIQALIPRTRDYVTVDCTDLRWLRGRRRA